MYLVEPRGGERNLHGILGGDAAYIDRLARRHRDFRAVANAADREGEFRPRREREFAAKSDAASLGKRERRAGVHRDIAFARGASRVHGKRGRVFNRYSMAEARVGIEQDFAASAHAHLACEPITRRNI